MIVVVFFLEFGERPGVDLFPFSSKALKTVVSTIYAQ